MQVILTEDVKNVGTMGEIVDVAAGYGRNYLIPQKLALLATAGNKKALEHQIKQIEARRERERAAAREILGTIDGVSVHCDRELRNGPGNLLHLLEPALRPM